MSATEPQQDIFRSAVEPIEIAPREFTKDAGPRIISPDEVHTFPREMFLPTRLPRAPRQSTLVLPDDAKSKPVIEPRNEPANETKCDPCQPAPKASLGVPFRKRIKPYVDAPVETVMSKQAPETWNTVQPYLSRLEFSNELLLWWMQRDGVPALASTGSTTGALNDPSTVVLFDSGSLDRRINAGYRWRGLYWLDEDRTCGIGAGFFFLGRRGDTSDFSSNDYATLARPVFLLNVNGESAEIVASPGLSTGVLSIDSTTQFWGMEANLVKRFCSPCDTLFDLFIGYRYLSLVERLQITEYITAGANAPDPAGTQILVQDRFHTNNAFHGGQIGARYERRWGRLSMDLRASVALGVTKQVVEIGGNQVRTLPGAASESFTGGLLATPSNIGHYSRNRFSVVPEVGLNLGYDITPRFRAFAGYNFLYWSSVVRPGQQIDRVVDVTQVPNSRTGLATTGQLRPGVLFADSSLWVQGINIGLEYRW